VARSDADYEATLLTNQVFGGGFSSRLNSNLREAHGYTYGAYSDVDPTRGIGLISIQMSVETPSTADAVRETFHELDALTAGEVGTDELERARQYLGRSVRTLFDTNSSTVSTLATMYAYDLPTDYYVTRPARLAGITPADVATVARRHFVAGGFTVVAVGDLATVEAPLRALGVGTVGTRTP
jgi:zinc protease